jgi:hypothetical protein
MLPSSCPQGDDGFVVGHPYTLEKVIDVLGKGQEESIVVALDADAEEVLERPHVIDNKGIL